MPKRIEPLSSRAHVVDKESGNGAEGSSRGSLAAPISLSKKGRSKPVKRKKSFWRRVWFWTQIAAVVFIILAFILGYFAYEKALIYYARAETYDLKKLDDLNVTSTFYDVNGEELGRIFVEDRIVLQPDEIPPAMRQAVMSAEDRRFYQHGAIDYYGIARAVRENLSRKAHGVQGASTIEQQLAKHLIGDFSRTLDRKFLEAFVAVRLEQNLTKDQIMNYYLNRIYFGKGYFGVGAAARGYFGKEAVNLTVPECALLAGIIRAPTSSSPRVDLEKAKWRRNVTLRQMLDDHYITQSDYIQYVETPIRIQPAKPSGLQTFVMAQAVKEMEQILSIEGTEEMPQGLNVRTNIDLHLQRAIEGQINQQLATLEPAAPMPVVPGAAAPIKPPLQAAALVADLDTGRVRAWIGGRDFSKSQFDHISMAHRESGALLQPLVYALGFDRLDLNPASMINASFIDAAAATASDMALGNPSVDLTKLFLSVQDAMALGSKTATTRVGLQLHPRAVSDWLHQAGLEQARIPDDKPNVFNPDPMTLGDITALYQILGNNGVHRKLKLIQSIQSRTGSVLYDDTKADRKNHEDELLNTLDDQQMTLTLQNALRTGSARSLTRDYGLTSAVAGMPGYSDGYRDAWFVGYSPKVLAGVWIGYDDSRAIGGKEVALKSAVPLWGQIMQQVQQRVQTGGMFTVPPALTKVEIDRSSGALKGLAGLAPAPGDIFVYLKKEQVDAAGSSTGNGQIQAPREWTDWLTTMFNEADETGLEQDNVLGPKRDSQIPALAEYKMPALRGDIISVDGIVYATTGNEKNLVVGWPAADQATADDEILRWMRSRLDELGQAVGTKIDISDADLLAQYHIQRYQPFTVMENVTPYQVGKIQSAGLENKGFGFQTVPLRNYPRGTELAHVLGYLSRDQQRNRGKYLSGDVIYDRYKGASGLEQRFNADLVGKDGKFMISTTPDGYARSAAVSQAATYGNNLRLSINSKIQAALEAAMAASPKKMKAGVMIDVHTGDVVAMASQPTFDPNIFVPSIAQDEWQLLNTDQYIPLLDRTIHAQYPPGSGFKTLTSIAAMKAGAFDPNWVYHAPGYFDIGDKHVLFTDEKGDVSFLEAFTHSWNTYFMTLGLKTGRDVLLDTARSLNFGSLTNIDLSGELPGMIPDPEYVKRVYGREFGSGDIDNTAIGQGNVLVTPLQMADFMAAVANGGTVYRPRLIQQIEDRNGNLIKAFPVQTLRTVTFDEKFMPDLKAAMINVIDAGTATVVHRDDMKIAAKTGTAQVGSKLKPRQIAWLSGYLPADNPQYSFSIMVEGTDADNHGFKLDDGLLGGVDAGAIAKKTFDVIFPLPGKKDKDSSSDKDEATTKSDKDQRADEAAADKDSAPATADETTQATPPQAAPAPPTNSAPVAPATGDAPPSAPAAGDMAPPAPSTAPQ